MQKRTWLPASTVATEARSRRLAIAEFAEGPLSREIGIVHRRGRVLSAAAQAFVRC